MPSEDCFIGCMLFYFFRYSTKVGTPLDLASRGFAFSTKPAGRIDASIRAAWASRASVRAFTFFGYCLERSFCSPKSFSKSYNSDETIRFYPVADEFPLPFRMPSFS